MFQDLMIAIIWVKKTPLLSFFIFKHKDM